MKTKLLSRDDVIKLAYKAGFYIEDCMEDDETGETMPPYIPNSDDEDCTEAYVKFANLCVAEAYGFDDAA